MDLVVSVHKRFMMASSYTYPHIISHTSALAALLRVANWASSSSPPLSAAPCVSRKKKALEQKKKIRLDLLAAFFEARTIAPAAIPPDLAAVALA